MARLELINNTHPQKRFLKMFFKILFYFGLGDGWYEESTLTKNQKILYKMWVVLAFSFTLLGYINQLAGHYRSDLTYKEKSDLTTYCFLYANFFVKIVFYLLNVNRVKVLLKMLFEGNRKYASLEIDKASVKKAMIYCCVLIIIVDCTMPLIITSGILIRIDKCKTSPRITFQVHHYNTIVTYYPACSQSDFFINLLRVLVQLWFWYAIFIINIIDCVVIIVLVFLGSKFKHLQYYFKNLRKRFLENPDRKNQDLLEEEFKRDFVVGINLHADALWCARRVQDDFGILYSILVSENIILIVICLLTLVRTDASEWNVILVLGNLAYILSVFILTGSFMMVAGDMTIEAEALPTLIFHSGWELNRAKAELRNLVVVAIQMSQEPVIMTAFGIFILSYENYIAILRLSYSFFTLMYSFCNF